MNPCPTKDSSASLDRQDLNLDPSQFRVSITRTIFSDWLKVLKDDCRQLIKAAELASPAAEWILDASAATRDSRSN
jgi:antirestriction protein ArdC